MSLLTLKGGVREGSITPDEAVAEANKIAAHKPKIRSGAACNDRIYRPKDTASRISQYEKERAIREETLKNHIPFISEGISDGFNLSQGLVLVGGVSGKGKSTVAANLIAGFLDSQPGKKAIVITNEDSTEAVYNRVACVQLKYNFLDFQRGRMKREQANEVMDHAKLLTQHIDVVDDDAYDMTCLEDVQAVLEYAADGYTGIVVLDYLQTVAFSRTEPQGEAFRVSKKLGLYLKDYGRKIGIPVLAFAQLRSASKENDTEFKDRVENDRTITNHAFQAIEIVPDFENATSQFIIHKDRFGMTQGKTLSAKFVAGRFESMGDRL
jgi:replicative DNA helicase